jgi:uncharacterized protein
MARPSTSTTPHEFPVPVASLDEAGKAYSFPIRAAWIRGVLEGEQASAAASDGVLDVRISKSGDNIVVHGTLKAELTAPCARCLESANVSVDQPIAVLYSPASSIPGGPSDEEHELTSAEADILPYEGDTLVLDDLVRDELLLEIPMIPLCSEDCPGMSPPPENAVQAGPTDEKPIDPRLAPLLRFKKS